jgi:hypothetical protein
LFDVMPWRNGIIGWQWWSWSFIKGLRWTDDDQNSNISAVGSWRACSDAETKTKRRFTMIFCLGSWFSHIFTASACECWMFSWGFGLEVLPFRGGS